MNPPPFLISFGSSEQFLKALTDDVRAVYGDDFVRLTAAGLPPVVSVRCLATLFGYSPKFVGALRRKPERYYRIFSIPKGKKSRTIHAPKVALKVIQKWFGFHLARALSFDESVYGFVEGRSAVDAAAIHCGSQWIYSVDIENFFPSTPLQKVSTSLMSIGYPKRGAELIAKLCCYGDFLAQGSPASPVLSNLIFGDSNMQLTKLAQNFGVRFTRYADDLVFSGNGDFPSEIKGQVRAIIQSGGWKIAVEKERFSKRPARLKVHGLLVHGQKPTLTKGYRNKLRAFTHLVQRGSVDSNDLARLKGHIAYAKSVEKVG